MGNVASWSGTKTLTCFEYYDQAYADYFTPGRAQIFHHAHINLGTFEYTKDGPAMDFPTMGSFKDIENEGYLGYHSGKIYFSIFAKK